MPSTTSITVLCSVSSFRSSFLSFNSLILIWSIFNILISTRWVSLHSVCSALLILLSHFSGALVVSCQGQSWFLPLGGGSSCLAYHTVVPVLQSYKMSVVTAILVRGTIVAVCTGALKIN